MLLHDRQCYIDYRAQFKGVLDAPAPHEALFFWYHDKEPQAMRMGKWKIHFPHGDRSLEGRPPGNNGRPTKYTYNIPIERSLFDLEADPGETVNLVESNPDVVARMTVLADAARGALGDKLTKTAGSEIRTPTRVK